jgi:hypothetical protein
MSDRLNVQSNMGEVDLRRNLHVDYLARIYDKKKKTLQMLQHEKNRYLDPSKFHSILDTGGESQ